ncbi:MAG TPA: hypothetical protein VK427_24645 [Kofleriaceae bacterium]|nr:hypothetical protein [Kofleriaceae bacterium]
MLRALLLGLLAVASCSERRDKADAPPTVRAAAGKVIELTGKVDATRDGKTRMLAVGSEVFADDQVATSADATVTIELFHNGARWAVVSNKTARVDSSLAWGLDRQAASAAAQHNSAAAGRNAERSAAETSATAAAPVEERAAPAEPPARAAPQSPGDPMPAPPPAPRPAATVDRDAPKRPGGGAVARGADALDAASVAPTTEEVAEPHRAAFKQCLPASRTTITLRVRGGVTTAIVADNDDPKVRRCVDAVAKKIEWPRPGTFEVELVITP